MQSRCSNTLHKGEVIMKHEYGYPTIMAAAGLAALLFLPSIGMAQAGLGSAASYAVLAGSTITNTGATMISGDVGLSPGGSITGMPTGQPNPGTIHVADGAAAQAQSDLTIAYLYLAGLPCNVVMSGVDLGAQTLTPGVYCFAAAAGMTGILTLDALGDTAAVFIFQIASMLTVAGGASVTLVNGAQSRHVWWQVGSSAILGLGCAMMGNVLAYTSITLDTNASLQGRALAQNGAVTMDTNSIAGPGDLGTPTVRETWGKLKVLYR
jgi:hypothetical protein